MIARPSSGCSTGIGNTPAPAHGSTVVVMGEAGIGKSRLVQHFLATIADARTRVVHLAASAFDEDSPLRPVIAFLRSAAQLDADTPHEIRLARLETLLAGDAAQKRNALPLFAELAGAVADDAAIRALPPEVLRERMLSALVEQFLLMAQAKRRCSWWSKTCTGSIPRRANCWSAWSARVASHKAMLLLTTREGFDAPWMAEHATLMPLGRLPIEAVAEMVQSLFGSRPMPPQLAGVIARRTEGVPLFIEAVRRSLLQCPRCRISMKRRSTSRIRRSRRRCANP